QDCAAPSPGCASRPMSSIFRGDTARCRSGRAPPPLARHRGAGSSRTPPAASTPIRRQTATTRAADHGAMAAERQVTRIIVGGDALALSTAHEMCLIPSQRVIVLWPADPEFAAAVEAVGANFVAGRPESRDGLAAAGVGEAASILALSRD